MELTDTDIEAIREAARIVKYGSVTINISESSDKLDLNVQYRIRIDKDEPKSGTKPTGKT
jgi:hypothetical protein